MPLEIERKFLLADSSWREEVFRATSFRQGYLSSVPERTVRIRTMGERGVLTIKGKGAGISRPEFEYEIPHDEALQLLALCEQPFIEKVRHEVRRGDHLWEIDVFEGMNEGLTVAEIELKAEEEAFERPDWLGKEVSDDARYFNAALARNPFTCWAQSVPGKSKGGL